MTRASRRTAYHESGHAVAHFFLPLAGKVERVTMHPDDLSAYNAGRHEVSHAAGFMTPSRTLPPVVGRSVDRAQLHDELIALLAGRAAEWVFAGRAPGPPPTAKKRDEILRHMDGSDDISRAFRLLGRADPLDGREFLRSIPDAARGHSREMLFERYGRPYVESYEAVILGALEARWREALEFVLSKWPHVEAVADALWKSRALTGDEVEEIIETVETRIQDGPAELRRLLEGDRQPAA